MANSIRGIISVVIGVGICVAQASGNYGNGHQSGYLIGTLLVIFGVYRAYRGFTRG